MNTVHEIIGHCLLPATVETFRANLIKQAETHDDYAQLTRNDRAVQSAKAQRNACLAVYDDAHYGALNDICDDLSKCVIALNVACKMLGISPAVRTKAILDWEETQCERGVWKAD